MTDVLDGPLGSYKKRVDPHVNELQARLRERKKLGLTHDLSDSDVIEDNDDGESDDDYINRFGSAGHQRPDRPSSAKRRSPLSTGTYDSGISLGDTVRPGQGNRFMKSSRGSNLPAATSQFKSEMPSITSPKHSPKDKQSLYSDGLHRKDRQSPTDSMSFEQKEAIIMNRKTPTKEMLRQSPVDHNKTWQPPSYRKVSVAQEEESRETSTSGLLRGRKTPQDPLLESINETPSPRLRKQSPGADKRMPSLDRKSPGMERKSPSFERKSPGFDRKSPGFDRKSPGLDRRSPGLDRKSPGPDRKLRESPKPLNLEDPLMSSHAASPRPKLKTDVFGSSSTMEAPLEDPTPKPRKSRFTNSRQKSSTESENLYGKKPIESDRLTGRKTPTEKDRFGRPKTPTEKDKLSGRKTPTGRTTPTFGRKPGKETYEQEKSKDSSDKREEPSLMDFLTGDVSQKDKQKKGKSKLFDDDDDDDDDDEEERKQKVRQVRRNRFETQKETQPEPDSFEALLAKKSYKRGNKHQEEESSVCEELEFEPGQRKTNDLQSTQNQSLRSYNKQRSDKQEAEDAIDRVAGEQSMMPIQRPQSAKKTTGKIVKPKPRHSLPGTPTPSVTLSETQFSDTKSLREAIFNEWKKERTKSMIQKKAEEAKKKEEVEKKKKEEAEYKRLENEAAFRTWKEQKQPVLKDKAHDKYKEEKKKLAAEREAEQKKREAEKEFKKWKELTDEKLKEKERDKKRAERQKEYEEKEKKRLREKDNESALRVWKSKKEDVIKHKVLEVKDRKKQTIKIEKDEKRRQEEEARAKYEKWLERKDKQKVTDKKMKYSSMESLEDKPAWSPASRTIPYGR